MNRTNFQKKTDEIIVKCTAEGRVPRLLLHACCAPCSSYVLEYLSDFFEITLLYYNPNISPKTEYEYRVEEVKRLISEMNPKHKITFVEGKYNPETFYEAAKGLEHEPERGRRCDVCFRLRLAEAARIASEGGYDYYCTTLSISPLKDAEKLNAIGNELSEIYNVPYLPSDFKKKGGYKRSIELSAQHNLYRQNYCGCVFSKNNR